MLRFLTFVLASFALNASANNELTDLDVDSAKTDFMAISSETGPIFAPYEAGHFVATNVEIAVSEVDNEFPSTISHRATIGESMTGYIEPVSSAKVTAENVDESEHQMHLMQSSNEFTMQLRTASAPWSVRIQPGLQYRRNVVTYTQHGTGIRITASPMTLHMFEGGYTQVFNGSNAIENDIWLSNDDGATWDLVAGRSLFGRNGSVTSSHPQTFPGRSGSNNCADPVSDVVLSIGGKNPVTQLNTNEVHYSADGINWQRRNAGLFTPGRFFTSCDINEQGHGFVIGGHAQNVQLGPGRDDYLLDDIWATNSLYSFTGFRLITSHAPFGPREEHLVLIGNSTELRSEILYVIGGRINCGSGSLGGDCSDGTMANDVWASSDNARTWVRLPTPPFGPRWGHAGVITRAGVLLLWGGLNSDTGYYTDTYTRRDMWASFDGGMSWNQCRLPASPTWVRGESAGVITPRGNLVIAAGYAYAENGNFQVRYNDVWRSTFSVENTQQLADRCGGRSVIPSAGTGMRSWPGSTPSTNPIITFSTLTYRAPWSPRIQPALFLQSNARTYINPNDGTTASTGPNWLLMYEGSLTDNSTNENDVYASADNGQTWVLIAGIALRGIDGRKESSSPDTSFRAAAGASNCENPTNDDVYALAGISNPSPGNPSALTNDVWYSSDAINWELRKPTQSFPPRYFSSCDIDNRGQIYLIGGQTLAYPVTYFNDVWRSTNKGNSWQLVTARAPFPPRSEHAVQVVFSEYYSKDLIYVMGGFTTPTSTGGTVTLNDVWVSSDARSWRSIRSSRASWAPRWGHGAVVTNAGVLLVLGGTSSDYQSSEDMWASLDGGRNWASCRLPTNGGIIRGEQAIVLTADEKLIVGNGYQYASFGRMDLSDLYISDMSFNMRNPYDLNRYCPGLVRSNMPNSSVGFYEPTWGPVDPDGPDGPDDGSSSTGTSGSSSSSSTSTAMIVGIILVLVVVLGAAFYIYRHHSQTGSWNPFSSEPPAPTSNIIDTSALFAGQSDSTTGEPSSVGPTNSATQMSNF